MWLNATISFDSPRARTLLLSLMRRVLPLAAAAALISFHPAEAFSPPSLLIVPLCQRHQPQHQRMIMKLFQSKDGQRLDKGFKLLEIASGFVPQGRIVNTAKEGWKFVWKRMMAELAPQDAQGNYVRPSYTAGQSRELFPDEAGRYHLYVGNPCPWCHRAKLAINVLELNDVVGMTLLEDNPVKASRGGWIFSETQRDPLGSQDLRELYDKLSPGGSYTGRCTAPLLVDKRSRKIVSNESADILRMLNGARFGRSDGEMKQRKIDLYPKELASKIDETNDWVYQKVNNGVYRCGFCTTQAAYDCASSDVRQGLERCEKILQEQPFICGSVFTEADVRLLPTILRFDGAYAPLFKAGGAHLRIRCDYPAIHAWLKRCWDDVPGVATSIDLADACSSYFRQLFPLNPGGIIPSPITPKDIGLR